MSRYRGARIRIIRRLDREDTLRGLTQKQTRRKTSAGQHGKKRRFAVSRDQRLDGFKSSVPRKQPQYLIRLQEKQKLRFNYGITNSQLIRYVRNAKQSKIPTGERLLQLLEMRFDNIVFRLGLAPTIPAARQLITHGHVLVNNNKLTIPSYQCQPKDVVSITRKRHAREVISQMISSTSQPPNHLLINRDRLVGLIKSVVTRKNVQLRIKELLVVEYYSRQV